MLPCRLELANASFQSCPMAMHPSSRFCPSGTPMREREREREQQVHYSSLLATNTKKSDSARSVRHRPFLCTVWGGRFWKRFCNMFSESSTGSWAELQLPRCPSKQVRLQENKSQHLLDNLPPQTVVVGRRERQTIDLMIETEGGERAREAVFTSTCTRNPERSHHKRNQT